MKLILKDFNKCIKCGKFIENDRHTQVCCDIPRTFNNYNVIPNIRMGDCSWDVIFSIVVKYKNNIFILAQSTDNFKNKSACLCIDVDNETILEYLIEDFKLPFNITEAIEKSNLISRKENYDLLK